MSSTEYIVALLSSAAVSAGLTAALFWLLQSWLSERLRNAIKHEYDVKLESHRAQLVASFDAANETHKARLQAGNAQAVERLKADLQVAAAERQVRFARVYEKVAECVAEMYLRLSTLTIAVSRYTSVVETSAMGSKEDRRLAMAKAMEEFDEYFRKHKLFLPKELAASIATFVDKLRRVATDFMYGVEAGGDGRYSDRDTWVKVDAVMRTEAVPLLQELEDEFRTLLGVPSSAAANSLGEAVRLERD